MRQAPAVTPERIRLANRAPLRPDRGNVLYWMTASRRPAWNHALDRAIELAQELARPLVVLEALRVDYRWVSDRHHAFVLRGMADNAAAFADTPVHYYPYVEPQQGAGRGLVERLARDACVVVTDDWPCFFQPSMLRAAAERLDVRLEAVDSVGLMPMRSADRAFSRAFDFRRFLQRALPEHLDQGPQARPFARCELPRAKPLPADARRRWPRASAKLLRAEPAALAALPIDHGVAPVAVPGGWKAGTARAKRFLGRDLEAYDGSRNVPDEEGTSGLSPYLHYGHVSTHHVLAELARHESWSPERVGREARGQRSGWWGMSPSAEALLDQLVTWRELGFNLSARRDDYERWESLPGWARTTLEEHARDERPALYDLADFESARTHEPLWNAAQNQLRHAGTIHNYLRMLWGKKVLHWSASPQEALATLIELNNKYALDGRDPSSYSGIFWIFGRYDRAWGPERPVFGKIRYMSSDNTRRKTRVRAYVTRWGSPEPSLFEA